jgi:hypothetical protein
MPNMTSFKAKNVLILILFFVIIRLFFKKIVGLKYVLHQKLRQ